MDWLEKSSPWIAAEAEIEAAHRPYAEALIDRAALQAGERVLDLGCGSGATVLAAAGRVGPEGVVTGFDIAPPMTARTAERAAALGQVRTQTGDAEDFAFAPASKDAVISLFGVMFFVDPAAAFANIRTVLRPGGRMVFAAWGSAADNPWFAIPRQAAVSVLGPLPPPPPGAPGPMAFADIGWLTGLLEAAGWADVSAEDATPALTPSGTARDAAEMLMKIGPTVDLVRQRASPPEADGLIAAITDEIARNFAAFEGSQGVRVPALVRFVSASHPH